MVNSYIKKILKHPVLLGIGFLILVGILFIYFKIFLTQGIYFEDTFLKKNVESSTEYTYIGENHYGDFLIKVKGRDKDMVDVTFKLPNNINRQYTVKYKESTEKLIIDYDIVIEENDKVVFEGGYSKNDMLLKDKNGEPYFGTDEAFQVRASGVNPFQSNYRIPLKTVADLVLDGNESIRGKVQFLLIAFLLLVITLIDMIFPMFFFALEHFLSVRDPEPSGFYLFTQKLFWIVSPCIVVGLLIYSII